MEDSFKEGTEDSDSSHSGSSDDEEDNSASVPKDKSQPVKQTLTQHTNPKWLDDLLENFGDKIIKECSGKTRKAVEEDKSIEV